MNTLNLQRWSALVASALLVLGAVGTTTAFAQSEEDEDEDSAELDRVVITGSRISRTAIEGPSPVTVIDREQIDREGFTTVSEALKSLNQVTGLAQNEAQAGTFTQNANSIDLRNLGPGRVLILVDGRRISDYPLPFNGQSNLVNISSIPLAAVDRIEFLASGASAIYGSDAVAGVVNIILRDDLANSLDVNVRYGDYTDGGGENVRFQGVGGFLGDNWNITYAFEYFDQDPIFAFQRDFMDSNNDSPLPENRIPSFNVVEVDILAGSVGQPNLVDPRFFDPNACDNLPGQELQILDSAVGERPYCGSRTYNAEQSILNGREQVSLYTSGALELGDHEIFAGVNYFQVDAELDSNFNFYFNAADFYIPNSNANSLSLLTGAPLPGTIGFIQRIFTNAEIGGPESKYEQFDEEVIDYFVGIRGQLFSPYWDYEISWNSSNYDLERTRTLLVDALVEDYFFNAQPGDVFGFPIREIDYGNFFSPITPDIWNQLTDQDYTEADSSNDVIQAVITGDLMDLPAGTVQMATVLEWGSQDYDINLDPRLVAGNYFFGLTGTGGGGERDRYAAGVEFSVPVTDTLQLSLAGRYDKYDDITEVDDAFTYNLGVEYRPTDRILLRGSWATSFRAPDMHFVFADPSGFFTTVIDQYLCRDEQPGLSLGECAQVDQNRYQPNIFGERAGNPGLEEEEGESFTIGFVVEPIDNLSITADWWQVDLDNIVVDNPLTRILELEADCRLGIEDINSGQCQDALGRITRQPEDPNLQNSEELLQVNTGPINAANNKVTGIDASLDYLYETDGAGTWGLNLGWTHVLDDDFNVFPEDPVENVRDQSINWRSRVRGSISWQYGDFTATLFGERFGSTRSFEGRLEDEFAEEPRMGPQMIYNASVGYTFLDGKADVTLIVDNLFDETPPIDQEWDGWPYFSFFNYYQFSLGQSWAVQFDYRFDY